MEKLFKVVCANFALENKKISKCSSKFEDGVEDALIMFVGLAMQTHRINTVSEYLDTDFDTIHYYQDRFSKKKGFRFGVKLGLIQNGMRL